jgi:hypothetical protein
MNLHRKLCVSTLWSLTKNIGPNLHKSFYLQRIWKYRKVVCVQRHVLTPRGWKKYVHIGQCKRWEEKMVQSSQARWVIIQVEAQILCLFGFLRQYRGSSWLIRMRKKIEAQMETKYCAYLGSSVLSQVGQSGMTLFGSRTKWRELALFGMRSK